MSGVKVILSLAFSKERVESMKVLMLNGSAKKEGNTYQSLLEVGKELERQGIEYEMCIRDRTDTYAGGITDGADDREGAGAE